jgi:hypothetical protein
MLVIWADPPQGVPVQLDKCVWANVQLLHILTSDVLRRLRREDGRIVSQVASSGRRRRRRGRGRGRDGKEMWDRNRRVIF